MSVRGLRAGERAPIRLPLSLSLGDAALSPDGRTLAIVASGQRVEIVGVATLRHRAWLSRSSRLARIRFTPDGRYVVGGSFKGWARLWSTKSGRPVSQCSRTRRPVRTGRMSPDGDTLAVGGVDGTIRR